MCPLFNGRNMAVAVSRPRSTWNHGAWHRIAESTSLLAAATHVAAGGSDSHVLPKTNDRIRTLQINTTILILQLVHYVMLAVSARCLVNTVVQNESIKITNVHGNQQR